MSNPSYAGRLAVAAAASSCLALALAGCSTSPASTDAATDQIPVAASFYPLQFVAERVGGDRVAVTNLTKPGAEPHTLELTPKDVAGMKSASLVVYLGGFQPVVDDAVAGLDQAKTLDVAPAAALDLHAEEDGHDHGHDHDATPSPSGESAAHDHEEALDPHFWLDPTRLISVTESVAERLSAVDAAGAATFQANASALTDELRALDAEFDKGLATCESRELVTGHAAFGYLAQRYDLHQHPIAGISPDQEPTAAQMAEVVATVKEEQVTTVFSETLVSPKTAETVAREAGAKVAVLDPVEGLTDASAGQDYLGVMRANLEALRTGLRCS